MITRLDAGLSDEETAIRAVDSEVFFDALVDRFTPLVYRTALNITGDARDAEDVVQETFLRVFRHIGSFDPKKGSFKTWLLTIARNQSVNVFSSIRRKTLRFVQDLADTERGIGGNLDPIVDPGLNPEAALSDREMGRKTAEALQRLPERQRTALILKTVEELSVAEIASVMKASESSVESLIFRARKTLAQELNAD
jgi:RNA polymerase sigma-70 factor (ECF subfamily)